MIRMTKSADYGIVLMTHMASEVDRLFSAVELSHETQLPHPTVAKILKILARNGLLESQRGAKGGYVLAKDPEEISVVEIITALDGPIGITECIDHTPGECGQCSGKDELLPGERTTLRDRRGFANGQLGQQPIQHPGVTRIREERDDMLCHDGPDTIDGLQRFDVRVPGRAEGAEVSGKRLGDRHADLRDSQTIEQAGNFDL